MSEKPNLQIEQNLYWKGFQKVDKSTQQKVIVTDLSSCWDTDPKSIEMLARRIIRCQDSTKVGRTIWNELSLGQSCERMKDVRQ